MRLIRHTDNAKGRPLALISAIRVWWLRRQTVSQLKRLPDHMLRDIGVERASIDATVRELFANDTVRSHRELTLVAKPTTAPRTPSPVTREAA